MALYLLKMRSLFCKNFQDQLKMFINFDEPVEAPIKEVSSEPEFNKNLLRKLMSLNCQ